ncbi:Lysophospholipase, alpha-beta hydrolase superfamily [Marinobacter sp. es.048]|uniref:alpha/beta hydrolase n=1 Tax=Marinobacter sp. es.048 TaxID=1761795 RepID=UPI000B58E867|nr:alpha/beta fold hydrolase [Marinobacter sp. es.048]SNC66014.1 Lysophospholipase, alpha-beta hydrolase superfamily [Marinobacter sp. es.048]
MRFAAQESRTLLLVPGAMTGKWIWEGNYADAFEAAGYNVRTMSFRGHDASFKERLGMRFEDYVDDCVSAIQQCPEAPLVLGHSLGGLISLHAAARTPVDSIALLSPAPVQGILRSMVTLALSSPTSLVKFGAALTDARVTRLGSPPNGIYSESCDDTKTSLITEQLRSESIPVLLSLLNPPKLPPLAIDSSRILFIGATGDRIIPPVEVEKSARILNSPCRIYTGLCHTYQAEKDITPVIEDLLAFFEAEVFKSSLLPTGEAQ